MTEPALPLYLIADDHDIIRKSVVSLVQSCRPAAQFIEAGDGLAALAKARASQPSHAIVDIAMPECDGVELIIELKRWCPDCDIMVFTGSITPTLLNRLLSLKVNRIVQKAADQDTVKTAIAANPDNTPWLCPLTQLMKSEAERTGSKLDSLTKREFQIFQLICQGLKNQDIAERLSISAKTVDNHRTQIMKKLDVHSVAELLHMSLSTDG